MYKMKKYGFGFFLGVCSTIVIAFQVAKYEPNSSTAEVYKIEGFNIFTDSQPIMPYDSLDTVDLGFVSGTQYESVRANLIKNARKKYPDADGLILKLNKKGLDQCVVIKFK